MPFFGAFGVADGSWKHKWSADLRGQDSDETLALQALHLLPMYSWSLAGAKQRGASHVLGPSQVLADDKAYPSVTTLRSEPLIAISFWVHWVHWVCRFWKWPTVFRPNKPTMHPISCIVWTVVDVGIVFAQLHANLQEKKTPKLLQDGKQANKGRSSSTTPKLAVAFYSIHTRMDLRRNSCHLLWSNAAMPSRLSRSLRNSTCTSMIQKLNFQHTRKLGPLSQCSLGWFKRYTRKITEMYWAWTIMTLHDNSQCFVSHVRQWWAQVMRISKA